MATESSSKSVPTSAAADSAAATNLRIGLDHKQRGNLAFTSGDMSAALAAYHHAVLYLSGLESRSILGLVGENSGREGKPDDLSSDDDDEAEPPNLGQRGEKELSLVYSNMSACYLKQQRYDRAVQAAEKALKCDSKNVKAKYRRCQALRLAGEVYRARAVGREAVEGLTGETRESFERELRLVEKRIEEKEEQGRKKWKGVLTGNGSKAGLFGGKAREAVNGDDEVGEAADAKLM